MKELEIVPINKNIFTSLDAEKAKYDLRSKYYEWLVSTNWFNIFHWNTLPKNYTKFAREPILEKSGSLIDIGCGGLSQTASLYVKTKNNCTLIDRSLGMLKVAEQRLSNQENKIPQNIKILQSDAFNLPFQKESFDILCSFGTLHLFDDKERFLSEILKVLKTGGEFYFLVMTNKYINSKIFMNFLNLFGEFGKVCSEKELLSLFPSDEFLIESYMKGSVLFIKGKKL